MYYRRKVLLALLEAFGGELEAIQVQKLLFLFEQDKPNKDYDFVPYQYGCFSFQANQDLSTLKKYGIVNEESNKWKLKEGSFFSLLTQPDKVKLKALKSKFENYSSSSLIAFTYKNYPYYALNSKVASNYLTKEEYAQLSSILPKPIEKGLFTIGYEGVSLEIYLNKLIWAGVTVLVDVRKNALSMKYGFSKNQLQKACEQINIQYTHIPDLGIDSDKRQQLNSQSDYDNLFEGYAIELPNKIDSVNNLLLLLQKNQRVAITCFEKSHCQCHRGTLASELSKSSNWDYPIIHL